MGTNSARRALTRAGPLFACGGAELEDWSGDVVVEYWESPSSVFEYCWVVDHRLQYQQDRQVHCAAAGSVYKGILHPPLRCLGIRFSSFAATLFRLRRMLLSFCFAPILLYFSTSNSFLISDLFIKYGLSFLPSRIRSFSLRRCFLITSRSASFASAARARFSIAMICARSCSFSVTDAFGLRWATFKAWTSDSR